MNAEQLKEMLITVLKAREVPCIWGAPGLGKSDVVKQISDQFNMKLIDIRLSQLDPVDLSGLPMRDGDKYKFLPSNLFPLEDDPIPEGYTSWLLFMDEISSAPKAVEAAAYKIILDRMVGDHKLHEKVAIVAAGNDISHGAIAYQMGTAMRSRLIHFELEPDSKTWVKWASGNNIHPLIIGFIEFRPDALHRLDTKSASKAFPTPRTWEKLSNILHVMGDEKISMIHYQLIRGCVGEGVARDFITYADRAQEIRSLEAILADPENIDIGEPAPDINIAYAAMISHSATMETVDRLMIFLNRLPIETQVVAVRGMISRDQDFYSSPSIEAWINKNAGELL